MNIKHLLNFALLMFLLSAKAQIINGKANIIEFTNVTAKFTVPSGKTWIIQNVFSDITTKFKVVSSWNNELAFCPIEVYIKNINGVIKTDLITKQFSIQMNNRDFYHPIYLPENTSIEFIITYDDFSDKTTKTYDGSAIINYIELSN